MYKYTNYLFLLLIFGCSKSESNNPIPINTFTLKEAKLNNSLLSTNPKGIPLNTEIILNFDENISSSNINQLIQLQDSKFATLNTSVSSVNETTIKIKSNSPLTALSTYHLILHKDLKSVNGASLNQQYNYTFNTAIDSTDKFNRVSDDELLTLVQKQTFKYFWDLAHPNSGMIRERNTSGETVTTGGTGFGLMAIVTAIHRNFITRTEGLDRVKNIVTFLKKADKYHGAFSHWYNGSTGKTQPFSTKDNGADLVETSLLFQGLLAAREYFNDTQLTQDINKLYAEIEWSFFQNGQKALFWHWSPTYGWEMNLKISGWNESLITYVLAAGSDNHSIEKEVYDEGWTRNGAMKNGKSFNNIILPLGPDYGGPLFTSQYSFLGINPIGLKDSYADYEQQVKNHTLINRAYCIQNTKGYYGYSSENWGLTASDIPNGYTASSPSNDLGIIAPTAALASMAYTPTESKAALNFFYYKLGDKLWSDYGFKDAFSLDQAWFADSYLAIDQGPIIVGIENHRSKLIWNLVMKAPEIKKGLQKLGFTSPNL